MLYTIIALFSLTAIIGLLLISYVLTGKETPKGMVFTHGPLAVIALVLLLIYYFKSEPGPVESLSLFSIAAVGGFIMVARDLMRLSIPNWLAITHGLLAAAGLIFLLVYAFNK